VVDSLAPPPGELLPILLIDQDSRYASFVDAALAQSPGPPLKLLYAPTLTSAERILDHTRVSVVLVDLQSPSGLALEWLRRRRARIRAAVIILAGSADSARDSSVVAGAQDFLVKSQVDVTQVVRTLRYAAERERAREQFLRSREYFQSLIERARDLITVVDEGGLILYQSPASLHILGTPPEQFIGQALCDLLDGDGVAVAREMLQALFTFENEEWGGEMHVAHADGGRRVLEVIASRIPEVGGRRRAVLNSRDVTERRRVEQELRQSQRMEAIGRLAGGIAHDFSNVLTVVTSACEKLRDEAMHGQPADLGTIDAMLRNCGRASSLTRQLLAFSRQQTLVPAALNLNELIEQTAQLLRQLIGEHIALHVDAAADLRAIEADRVQIEQVLLNLAINARDAMEGGGSLSISVRNVTVTEAFAHQHQPMCPGSYVLLQVTDTGHGMTDQVKRRAFEPFFTTKAAPHGTGLGLSTVYGIVKQSGGFIWIDSCVGRGTTFSIYFAPSDAVPIAPAPPLARVRTVAPRRATILLTEDEEDVRSLLSDMLSGSGYTVLEAVDANDAVNRSDSHDGQIDLLLTDVVMPGGTGPTLGRAMMQRRPNLKVLYMSGYPEFGASNGSGLEPGVAFIPKPFTRDLLLEQIRNILA
jgi:two-component system cell cycle sensor histidine kinase/response regulator CckA